MKNDKLEKQALIESMLTYRNTIVSKNMVVLEDQTHQHPQKKTEDEPDEDEEGFDDPETMLDDEGRKNWKIKPDVMSGERNLEKIPGLFSTKEVKVGTTTPSLVKEGEQVGDIFGNASKKRASWKDPSAKKRTPEEMKQKGSTLSDLQQMPGYGYPAILYDEEAILNLKFTDQDKAELGDNQLDPNNWAASDIVSLKSLVKSKLPQYWEATKLSGLWVSEVTVESGHDSHDMVPVYEFGDKKSAQQRIPYGFYTHFYTIDEGEGEQHKKKVSDGVMVKIKPHNRATSKTEMALAFNKIGNTGNIVAAARVDDKNVILMKIPMPVFKFIMY